MGTKIENAPQATDEEIKLTNYLIEQMKKQISYFELMINKEKTILSFSQITETLKYIQINRLSTGDMKHIVKFCRKYTFENTKEESLANTLKHTFATYKTKAKITQLTITSKLKKYKDIIKINDAYLLETSAYNIADAKDLNRTLFDFLQY